MQQTLQHILVPMDFSDGSFRALEVALSLSEKHRAQVHLVHVAAGLDEPDTCSPPNCLQVSRTLTGWLAEAITHRFELKPTWTELSGHPATQLVRWLHHHPCDLAIVGRCRSGHITDSMMGSTTYQLLKHSTCPVLVMPGKCFQKQFSNMLFPFRPVSGTLSWLSFSRFFMASKSKLHLLPFEFDVQHNRINSCRMLVEEAAPLLKDFSVEWPGRCTPNLDNISEETLAAMQRTEADMLVLPPSLAKVNAIGHVDPALRPLITATTIPLLYLCNAAWGLVRRPESHILSAF